MSSDVLLQLQCHLWAEMAHQEAVMILCVYISVTRGCPGAFSNMCRIL